MTDHDHYLDSCLAIDCNLAQNNQTPISLSSSSSTTSTCSSSTIDNSNMNTSAVAALISSKMANLNKRMSKKSNYLILNKNIQKSFAAQYPNTSSNLSSPCASSSSECLSSDEGYVGSYSDTSVQQQQQQISNDQIHFFQYLLSINHQFNNNNNNDQIELIKPDSSQVEFEFKIPDLFTQKPELDDISLKFFNLISENSQNEDFLSTFDWLIPTDCGPSSPPCLCIDSTCSFKLNTLDELERLNAAIAIDKREEDAQDEIELSNRLKWRGVVEKRKCREKKLKEFDEEDEVDLNAYLNEIEMNLDYIQFDHDYDKISIDLDQMLTFRSNKMAFNLRMYHKRVHEELELNKMKQKKSCHIFANLHVDSIQEFIPVPFIDEHDYSLLMDENEYTMIECVDENSNSNIHEQEDQTEMFDEASEENNNCNNNNNNNTVVELSDEPEYEDGCYYDYNEAYYTEDYDDYEDQALIDSLTEEEALALLRSESELYALQMSQASKYGLLKTKNLNLNLNLKSRFNSGLTDQSDDFSSTKSGLSVDIFENVFNYDESPNTDCEEPCYYLEPFEQFDIGTNISQSLRNSLLKLRESRRHMTSLLELNSKNLKICGSGSNGSTTPSSTTSSLTTTSNMSLYKQNLLNQQHLSRKPCVYMLNEGRCMRADCRFVHDLKTITCKYWLEGECLKGENCEFAHDYIEIEQQVSGKMKSSFGSSFGSGSNQKSKKAIEKMKKDFKLDTEEFPALGGLGMNSSVNSQTPAKTAASVLLANVVVVKTPQEVKKTQKLKSVDKKKIVASASNSSVVSSKSAQKHKSRGGVNCKPCATPVVSISSCGASSCSSSATSSRANSKIRVDAKK